jgi:hypothetical protein
MKALLITALMAMAGIAHASNWSNGSYGNKMEGTTNYTRIQSSDYNLFKFPYNGKNYAYIQINGNGQAMFQIDKGQIQCFQGCGLKIKIDNQQPFYVNAAQNDNGQNDYVTFCPDSDPDTYICNSKSLIEKIKNAKTILVSAKVYQEGNPVWEFKVDGFTMPRK